MRIRAFASGLACLAAGLLAFTADAAAQSWTDSDAPYGPRGLNGRTYTTSRVPVSPYGPRTDGPGGTGSLGALIFRDPRFQNVLLPCDAPGPLERIQKTFAQKEERFWNSPLTITGFDSVRLVVTNPWGQNNIPRRYCTARAHLSDGRVRPVSYAIMEDQGLIGLTWGVEWCVHGLDRGRSFDPACRMARP
jgi:hypothetical protein